MTAAQEKAQATQRKGKGRSRAGERDHPVPGTALRDRARAGLLRDLARRRAAATVHRVVAGHPGRLERRLDPLYQAGGPGPGRPGPIAPPRAPRRPGHLNRPGRSQPRRAPRPPRLARARPSRLASAWRPPPPYRARAPSSRPRCSRPASSAGSPGFSGLPVGREPGQQPANLVPHVIYLAVWAASAVADPARRRPPAGRSAAGAGHERGHVRLLLRRRRPGDRRRRAPDGRRPRAGAGRLARVHGGSGGGAARPGRPVPAPRQGRPGRDGRADRGNRAGQAGLARPADRSWPWAWREPPPWARRSHSPRRGTATRCAPRRGWCTP